MNRARPSDTGISRRIPSPDADGQVQDATKGVMGHMVTSFRASDHRPSDGMSPAKIAATLTDEGTPGPRGRKWRDTIIRGDRARRTGILHDEIYIGRSWVPGRDYGRAPALRIVSDDLWTRVKRRQGFAARGPAGSP